MLAPLTKGNNLPFRRLCAEFGATVTMSEMVYARQLIKGAGRGRESALLKRHPSEQLYGVQIATNIIDEGIKAAEMAVAQGADWVDLNCGCPIYEATRRGLGSALLRKPTKLARLVSGISAGLTVPFTVKVRTGLGESSINVDHVVTLLKDAGAAAVTIHGRTALQRYKRPSDWSLIEQVARSVAVPVIGNGDVLTAYEARRRLTDHGCLAVMVGRGALIKPWIFEETRLGCELAPTALERVGMYRRLVSNMKDHFGDDDMGKRKAFYFLPWHLGFFCRYRPLPESVFGELSLKQPLISTRWESVACPEVGETVEGLSPLERLLRCEYEGAHAAMADTLWEAKSDGEAASALEALAATELAAWEEEMKLGRDDRDRDNNDRETEG